MESGLATTSANFFSTLGCVLSGLWDTHVQVPQAVMNFIFFYVVKLCLLNSFMYTQHGNYLNYIENKICIIFLVVLSDKLRKALFTVTLFKPRQLLCQQVSNR